MEASDRIIVARVDWRPIVPSPSDGDRTPQPRTPGPAHMARLGSLRAVEERYHLGCGIKMNERWTQLQFNRCDSTYCSPHLRYWYAQDGGAWHKEIQYPGWYPNCRDHWLNRVSGNVGYTWVSIQGHQGHSYRGVFDTSGNGYYNSYTNNLTGNANGTWSCSYSYYWKKSAHGWHTQSWCGTGTYPG